MLCSRCHRRYGNDFHYCPYDGGVLVSALAMDMIATQPSSHAGTVLGNRYQIYGLLGRGAMGQVLLAEDLETKEPVAVKLLAARHAKDPDARKRFLREAKAAALIGHPNIVRILDTGEREDGAPYLVMEFLFGESLGDFLRRQGIMEPDIALPVAQQTASALAAAHRAQIIHRDVKPDNIFLVGKPGDPYAVRLVDFGLAKLIAHGTLTKAGIVVGTPEYMAPEQVVADPCDARTDLYGFGMVMFRMFSGTFPYDGKTDADLLAHQLAIPPPAPSQKNPAIDPRVEIIVLTALRKHPDNRYSSLDDLLEDLERILGDRAGTVEARPLHCEDVYQPKEELSRRAARFFYRRVGLTAPTWETEPST